MDKVGAHHLVEEVKFNLIIADGSRNRAVRGQIAADIELSDGTEIRNQKFVVFSGLPVDILFGLDCVELIGPVTIDAARRTVTNQNHSVLITALTDDPTAQPTKVSTSESCDKQM